MFRAAALSFGLVFIVEPAVAETIVVRPDPCPADAERPLIIDLGEVEIFNAAPAKALGNILVIYPPPGDGWASERLLMRFEIDREFEPSPADACASRKLFRFPR